MNIKLHYTIAIVTIVSAIAGLAFLLGGLYWVGAYRGSCERVDYQTNQSWLICNNGGI